MSSIISQSPIGAQPNQPPPVTVPVQAAPEVQAALATPDPSSTPHDDTSERQRRAVNAVKDALSKASGVVLPPQSKLIVVADKDSGRYVYEFQDPVTGEIIVQYPDKHVLAVLAAANVAAQGAVVSRRI